MRKIGVRLIFLFFLMLLGSYPGQSLRASNQLEVYCLFKNPLCFYNLDVLRYLQVLHQKQEYEQMSKFFYGPLKQEFTERQLANSLANVDFGYDLKRVGIKEQDAKHWSLTYQRISLGTKENFKIEAALVNDTCRVYLDQATWVQLFEQKPY